MWFKKSKPSRKSQKMLEETSGPQKNIGKNRWKKIQMTTWQGSTRTRESLRNAAVYHGVKVNEFQAGLKNHSRLQKGFLLHGILVSSWAKKKNGGSQESTMQEFSRCRQEGGGFCLPIPQLWKCFSGGPMLLTDWMSTIISGSIFIMFAQIGQPFFSGVGVGVKLQKNTQTHTTQHLRNTFPGRCSWKAATSLSTDAIRAPKSEFPFNAKAESSSFKKNETITVTRHNFWWFLPPKCFKHIGDFQSIVG